MDRQLSEAALGDAAMALPDLTMRDLAPSRQQERQMIRRAHLHANGIAQASRTQQAGQPDPGLVRIAT